MVNVPPIPPLLCSTPPPMDFGDDDEDLDVNTLPPTLGGIPDEEDFGDYIARADSDKNINESLPSPRPPSVTDLPTVGEYDGSISLNEKYAEQENHTVTLDDQAAESTTPDKRIGSGSSPSTPITEAFNFNVKKEKSKQVAETSDNEFLQSSNETPICIADGESQLELKVFDSDQIVNDLNLNKDLTIQLQSKPTDDSDQTAKDMVSIEDLEDDLSEDELYSPKTTKNFTDMQDMSNFFTIHEINNESVESAATLRAEEKKMPSDDLNVVQSEGKCVKSEKNMKFADYSHTDFSQQEFDSPPPLDEEVVDDNDDFGDFADFQDFSSTPSQTPLASNNFNNNVPANNSVNHRLHDDDFHIVNQLNLPEKELKEDSETTFDLSQLNNEICKETDNGSEIIAQEKWNNNRDDHEKLKKALSAETIASQEDLNESFGEFEEATKTEDKLVMEETAHRHTNIDNDADFGDFADFEQHQVAPPQVNQPNGVSNIVEDKPTIQHFEDDETDDDFGDFNTAEPINASALTATPASQTLLKQPLPLTQIPQPTSANLNERISKILQIMFVHQDSQPSSSAATTSNEIPKTEKLQDIPFTSVDAAKALEYQWLGSETRHSFIKSLGIDSRNILYGDNWNPLLPRYAANLSFNPLKPMKPVTSNSSGAETTSFTSPTLEPVTVNNKSNYINPVINNLGANRDDNTVLDWSSSVAVATPAGDVTTDAFKDITFTTDISVPSTTTTTTTSTATIAPIESTTSYEATETIEAHTIFDNRTGGTEEEKFSKTPPISEMESVNSFASPLTHLEIDLPSTASQILSDYTRNDELNDVEDFADDTLEVVVTSTTFAGSFKETHIYTPPKTVENSSSSVSSTSTTSPSKTTSIDFDYEKAAMGVIIDEMVVKKEYRDIEYNSPFSINNLTKSSISPSTVAVGVGASNALANNGHHSSSSPKNVLSTEEDDFNDEFSEFQSVPSESITSKQIANNNLKSSMKTSNNPSPAAVADVLVKQVNVSTCGMILSPAILIPQAISMENQKPKIEWGDSTASINPEELARIEELFPEPKSVKSNNSNSNSSQRSTPTHQINQIMVTTPSISAAVANKELECNNDDDDWSDFVSVPVTNTNNNKILNNNNLGEPKTPSGSPFKQKSSSANSHKVTTQQQQYKNSNNDDEWSDFVSGAPALSNTHKPISNQPQQGTGTYRPMPPQFNSGAWQNANFYNNPLSLYHKGPLHLNSAANQQHNAPKNYINNNNNNNYTQYNQFQMSGPQQQIHIMQNFSTAPVPTAERHSSVAALSSAKNNQFQVGSAKVAPSIALIPDLGFVAPAIPTHTSFISALPKPSINSKK